MTTPKYNHLKATLSITKASLQSMLKSPSAIVFSLAFPIIFILVFGFIGGSSTMKIDVAFTKNCDTNNPIYQAIQHLDMVKVVSGTEQEQKEALLKGRLNEIGEVLDFGFQQKRQMAEGISNTLMEEIYETAKKSGATGGKISGAGGGGFMIFYCPGNSKHKVMEALNNFGGHCKQYQFVDHGLMTWTI